MMNAFVSIELEGFIMTAQSSKPFALSEECVCSSYKYIYQ